MLSAGGKEEASGHSASPPSAVPAALRRPSWATRALLAGLFLIGLSALMADTASASPGAHRSSGSDGWSDRSWDGSGFAGGAHRWDGHSGHLDRWHDAAWRADARSSRDVRDVGSAAEASPEGLTADGVVGRETLAADTDAVAPADTAPPAPPVQDAAPPVVEPPAPAPPAETPADTGDAGPPSAGGAVSTPQSVPLPAGPPPAAPADPAPAPEQPAPAPEQPAPAPAPQPDPVVPPSGRDVAAPVCDVVDGVLPELPLGQVQPCPTDEPSTPVAGGGGTQAPAGNGSQTPSGNGSQTPSGSGAQAPSGNGAPSPLPGAGTTPPPAGTGTTTPPASGVQPLPATDQPPASEPAPPAAPAPSCPVTPAPDATGSTAAGAAAAALLGAVTDPVPPGPGTAPAADPAPAPVVDPLCAAPVAPAPGAATPESSTPKPAKGAEPATDATAPGTPVPATGDVPVLVVLDRVAQELVGPLAGPPLDVVSLTPLSEVLASPAARDLRVKGSAAVGTGSAAGARATVPASVSDAGDVPVAPPVTSTPVPPVAPAPAAPSAPSTGGTHACSSSAGSGGQNDAVGLPAAVLPVSWVAPPASHAALLSSGIAGSVVGGADDPGCSPD
ncbi:hypothetical protein ACI78Q_00150 [Geodermatophilus sp. SYSU D00705]